MDPQTPKTMTLYRPVGPEELDLIAASGFRQFPPRLPEQPIFYPVLNEEYAAQIARDWNVKASGAGFVTRFEVDAGRNHQSFGCPPKSSRPQPAYLRHHRGNRRISPFMKEWDGRTLFSPEVHPVGVFNYTHLHRSHLPEWRQQSELIASSQPLLRPRDRRHQSSG